ncbi:MAG TPA: hypothetical protein VIV58_27100, partial [Kofleriaceae bacterium]
VRAETPGKGIQTQPTDPLPFETTAAEPASKRRLGLYAAIGAVVIALAIGIAVIATGGKKPPAPQPAEPVVMATEAPKPPPPVVDQPKPVPPPVATETKTETKIETPPPVADTVKKPVIKRPPVKPPVAATKVEHVQETKPAVESKTAPPAAYDANAFRSQWATVGQELKAFSTANGVSSVSDLQTRYSRIVYVTANSSQANRDEARRELDAIHAALGSRKK